MSRKHKGENRENLRALIGVLAAFVLTVAAGVVVFLHFYNAYIDGVLYRERLSQMKEVTTQLFSGLEDVVRNQWEDVNTFTNYVELGKPQDTKTLLTFMKKQSRLNNMDVEGDNLVAVDELGRYLTQDGWQGTLEEMDLLLEKPERLSFVSKSLTSDETYMYFLNRLPEPIAVQDGDRSVNLIYYGVARDMRQLNDYFTCAAYDDSNSVYVLSEQGMRLFQSGSSLVDGYNAYTVLESMEYLHGHSFEDAKAELDNTGHGYANAVLEGEEYYYALYRMDYAQWVLLFLVPSSYVASNVVSMVNTTVQLIMLFAVTLLGASAFVIYVLLRYQQKKAVDAERRNSQRLADALEIAERAEQAANAANHAKSSFLANMSHDIRTPMNAIVGITKLMEHEQNDPEKLNLYIHKVQQSSQHLLSLINDVLDMSKIESSAVTLNAEPVKLADQVGQIESIIRSQTEERGQSFLVRVHEIRHEYLLGDAVRLRQIFLNLLSNAIKYTPNGGKIILDLGEEPSDRPGYACFRIAVTDSGYGMTQEFLTHIFEPFTRAENSTTNRVQGTGLGMAITKSIVELMGGTITVESAVNQGSRFEVVLPLKIDASVTVQLPLKRVLLITDDPEFGKNLRACFSQTQAELYLAVTEQQVDEILDSTDVELILLGEELEGKRLEENLGRLRKKTKNALLLYCCNYDGRSQLEAIGDNGGVDGVLARPLFLSAIAGAVEYIRSGDAHREERGESALKGMRFLCAEDNALNAEILEALLDMNGAKCDIYPNGRELVDAFAAVKPGEYDAILMDMQMPVMDGLDATRAIRLGENPLGKTIPIIAMTANAFSEDVQNCLNAGMNAHVAKPLDIAALEQTIKSVLSGKFSGGGTLVRR